MLHVKGWQPIEPVYTIDKNGDYVLDANGDKILNTKNASYSPLGVATSPYGSDFKYIAETNIERQDISTWTTRLFADVNFL